MALGEDSYFQLSLFQSWQLLYEGTEIHVATRQQRLISAVALIGSRHRRYYSGLLWPDSPERLAAESLRASIHVLSRQVPGLLISDGPALALSNDTHVDYNYLLDQLNACELENSVPCCNDCLPHLLKAELLPGWYEDWVVLEQERLRNVRLRSLLSHARVWLAYGDCERAVEAAEIALELEPLYESCIDLLMRAEAKLGNRARALRTFETFKKNLAFELGVGPSDALLSLAVALRR